ncbi:hypothetical protein VKT23_002773 [Stygiomarasmius scandens]|uniref:Uncharacterized protein n=1 Tax=Marasmiellus scandens TaxID=2682957 RepID=A0ABR1JX17_9AGAR
MVSFKLSAFATLASIIVSVTAAPVPGPPSWANGAASTQQLSARTYNCEHDHDNLPSLIGSLKADISPLVNQLQSLSPADCTLANISPIVVKMKDVLGHAIVKVRGFEGVDVSTILSTGSDGGVIGLVDLCTMISSLFSFIFGCFGIVMNVVVSGDVNAVVGLFAEVGSLCGIFLRLVCGVVGGLNGILIPMLGVVFNVAGRVGCSGAFSFLFDAGAQAQ